MKNFDDWSRDLAKSLNLEVPVIGIDLPCFTELSDIFPEGDEIPAKCVDCPNFKSETYSTPGGGGGFMEACAYGYWDNKGSF